MDFSLSFVQVFYLGVKLAAPIFILFIIAICALGVLIGRREKWKFYDSLYYSFITATTVGYGDFKPLTRLSKLLAILIAFLGLMFTGIFVSLAVNSASIAFQSTYDMVELEAKMEILKSK